MINIVLLPILIVVLGRSGDTEGQVIREQLSGEGKASSRRRNMLVSLLIADSERERLPSYRR